METAIEFDLELSDVEIDLDGVFVPSNMNAFYEKEFFFSYSSSKLLLYHPPSFKTKYIDNVFEEKLDKHLINGKLIHCLILEAHNYEDMFIMSPLAVPATGKTRNLIHDVVKEHKRLNNPDTKSLADYEAFILSELVRVDLHQSLKTTKAKDAEEVTGDAKRIEKVLTEENISYFEHMLKRGSKNVIDQAQLEYCTKAAEIITKNKAFRDLMGMDAKDSAENQIINEKMYYMSLKDYKFGLKGILDNIHINHTSKIIHVNDFKTTGRELAEFPKAIELFGYDIQAVVYMMLIWSNHLNLIDDGYTVEFCFIAIDPKLQAYPFKVSEKTLSRWMDKFQERLKELDYHYTNKEYEMPFMFATGAVQL